MMRWWLGCLFCLVSLLSSAQTIAPQPRLVFAHYMVTNQDYQGDSDPTQEKKIEAYEREIREAQAVGIDGFALNEGGWLRQPYYIRYTAQMFEAAVRLNSGFKLMFSADMCCGNTTEDIEDMMRRFAGNPRYAPVYFQQNGKFVLTTFAGENLGPAAWLQMRIDLLRGTHPSMSVEPMVLATAGSTPSNAPVRTMFVPAFFWGGEVPAKRNIEAGVTEWGPTIDGAFYWGIAGVPGLKGLDIAGSSADYARVLHAANKLYMAPVALQFWGSNADRYFEYGGAAGMRALWRAAIENHADWVEIITWNDFIEGTYISPIDDPNKYSGANFLDASHIPLGTLSYFHSHQGATELLRYFVGWYKSGKPPAITQDELFFFYRTQPVNAKAGVPSVANQYGKVRDSIFVTTNLTAAAVLTMSCGEKVATKAVPAGSTDTELPFAVGCKPHFTLTRKEAVILSAEGIDAIEAQPVYRDFYYSTGFSRAAH